MLLAVDIGNSNIKFGIYDGENLLHKCRIQTKRDISPDEIGSVFDRECESNITGVLICSVVPDVHEAIAAATANKFEVIPRFVKNTDNFGLDIKYEPLLAAGTDRLVNAFAAVEKHGPPCIVCSFGTALTIDVVSADSVLLGGIIAPGMKTMAKALGLATSQLPDVPIEKPHSVIQNTTVGSIQSGIVYGYFGLVGSLIDGVRQESGSNAKVIATGGFARLVAENISHIDLVDENLLLDGLMRLDQRLQPA